MMTKDTKLDGNALVYCQGAFNTTNGKTAHGLVRFTERYNVVALIDSRYRGQDAGKVLDGRSAGIPIVGNIDEGMEIAAPDGGKATYLVVGLAPDGGRLDPSARTDVLYALGRGLNVDSGLHDFLSDDPELVAAATQSGASIRDIRKTPGRHALHFFSDKIREVNCLKIAVLGTDSAIGKRTTAWILIHGLRSLGIRAEMIGTGQTAWMQGARYSLIMDSLINDFVSGEIEHAVYEAWINEQPDVIIIEGQGSLMNPAYPGGFEILAAGRPDFVILQHAPKRVEYDGFPGYLLDPLQKQIQAIEILSGKPVRAVTINHEGTGSSEEIAEIVKQTEEETGLPASDVLTEGAGKIIEIIKKYLEL